MKEAQCDEEEEEKSVRVVVEKGSKSLSMFFRPLGLAPRDVKCPSSPGLTTKAYRSCQPMHVLSFGEGRIVVVDFFDCCVVCL